jgi:hypothetical protein
LAIAATCDLETLMAAGGRAGNFLFEQSRELPNEEKPRSWSKQAKVSLAPINSTHPSGTHSNVNTASGAQCGGVAEAPVATYSSSYGAT